MPQTETTRIAAKPDHASVFDIVVSSAGSAVATAFLVSILGGVAFSIAGGFAGEMIPSLPPGFTASPNSEHHEFWKPLQGVGFGVLFAFFFAHSLWVGFRAPGVSSNHRALRLVARLRRHWFGLIVGNAISAWVAAVILAAIPNFSLTHILWQWLWSVITPTLSSICRHVFGASNASTWTDWYSWYQSNNHRLYFWALYLAGVCDDLGLPNFKTLARFAWRRYRQRQILSPTLSAPNPAPATAKTPNDS